MRAISRLGLRAAGGLLALGGLGAAAATRCDDDWHKKLERQMAEAFSNQRPSPSSSSSSSSSTSSYRYTVQLNGGFNLCTKLALVNGLVYAAWQVPSLQYTMQRWFVTGYGLSARSCTQALLSSYSHASILHLLANMMGLLSFGPMCMDGWETRRAPRLSQLEFMSLYTVAGVGAGLGSSLFSQRWGTGRSGLGASGSLFAALTYAICCYQDSRVYFFFIIEMPAKHALLGATVLNIGMVAKEVMAARGRSEWWGVLELLFFLQSCSTSPLPHPLFFSPTFPHSFTHPHPHTQTLQLVPQYLMAWLT
jgi:membrane associated rhomboid family serine protease